MRPQRALLAALAFCALAAAGLAQPAGGGSGSVAGRVLDEHGDPVVTVVVQATGPNLLQPRKVAVEESGAFHLADLPAGPYALTVADLSGAYQPAQLQAMVRPGEVTSLGTIRLKAARGGSTVVDVVGRSDQVDLTEQQKGGTVDQTVLETLPQVGGSSTGRRYQDYLVLIPGVRDPDGTGNPYIHGMNTDTVGTTVGGASTRDPATGTFGANLNVDAIEAIEVITTAPQAEYGRALGGFVNVITKSGGDQVAGNLSFDFRSAKLDRNGSTLIPEDRIDFSVAEISGTISGPIVKQKLWYLVSFQDVDLSQPSAVYGGIQVRNFYRDSFFRTAKLTWQATSRVKLTAEYNRGKENLANDDVTQGNQRIVTVDEAGGLRLQTSTLFSLNAEFLVSDKLVLRAALSHFKTRLFLRGKDEGAYYRPEDLDELGAEAPPVYPVGYDAMMFVDRYVGRALYYGNYLNPYDRQSRVRQASVSAEVFVDDFLGRHDIKGGIQYMGSRTATTSPTTQSYFVGVSYSSNYIMAGLSYNLSYYFAPGLIEAFCPTMATLPDYRCWLPYLRYDFYKQDGFPTFTADDENVGIYLQDAWRPTERLVFNLGLRYDRAKVTADGFAMDLVDAGYAYHDRETGDFGILFHPPDTNGNNLIDRPDVDAWLGAYYASYAPGANEIQYASLSPRFGVNFDVFGDGRSKVSFSWARLYDYVHTLYSGLEGRASETKIGYVYSNYWPDPDGGWGFPGFPYDWRPDPDMGHYTGEYAYLLRNQHVLWYLDPELRAPSADEWSVGFERNLFPNTVLKVLYVSKRSHGEIVARTDSVVRSTKDPVDETTAAVDIFQAYMLTNATSEDGGLQYDGLEITFEKHIADNWQMIVSYTYGRTKAWNVRTNPRDPTDVTFEFDYAPWDLRHDLKIYGVWFLPKDFRLGWNFAWQSGYLFRRAYEFPAVGDLDQGTNYYGTDTARTQSFWSFDILLEKDFNIGSHSFNVGLSVDDLLNSRHVVHSAGTAALGYGAQNGERGNAYSFGRRWKISLSWEF